MLRLRPQGQRSETPLKRADRNFAELLQELRVAQTGVQILFAFLLGLAFTDRFARLGATERDTYIATLAASALTGALLVAPVMVHRLLFQRGFKCELVRIGHRFAIAGLCGLLTAIVGGLLLVLEVFFGGSAAVVICATLAAIFASLWIGPALWVRHRHPREQLPGQPQEVATAAPVAPSGNPPAAPQLRGTWTCDETGRLTLSWQLIDPPGETPSERPEIVVDLRSWDRIQGRGKSHGRDPDQGLGCQDPPLQDSPVVALKFESYGPSDQLSDDRHVVPGLPRTLAGKRSRSGATCVQHETNLASGRRGRLHLHWCVRNGV